MLSLDVTKKCVVAEGWSPVFATSQVSLSNYYFNVVGSYLVQVFCYRSVLYPWPINTLLSLPFQVQDALKRATYDSNSQVGCIFQVLHTKESPPTYFQTNKFTSAFQEIVDAYG